MAFDQMSDTVRAIIEAGGMGQIASWRGGGLSNREIYERLYAAYGARFSGQQFGPIADALIRRFDQAREAGATLNRRRSDRPLTDAEHVGGLCGQTGYQYQVSADIRDDATGRTISRLVTVNSSTILGKLSILDEVSRQLEAVTADASYMRVRYGNDQLSPTGKARILAAFRCI